MELPNRPLKEGEESKDENVLLEFIFYGIIPWVLFLIVFFETYHLIFGNIK
jgi:hypothetical protein